MAGPRGFVLLNALIVVIAISAIATAMLSLSARATARLSVVQADHQMALYLDGAEALITTFLEQEWDEDGTDHLGELWAGDALVVPIDRGRIGARLTDLQGRLNLNEMAVSDAARAELERLFTALSLPLSLLAEIEGFLADGGPPSIAPYLARAVPVLPRGGPARLLQELRAVEGMTDAAWARLAPFVTVLPPGTPININTAPAEVLQAVMPELSPPQIVRIGQLQQSDPFASGLDFRIRMAEVLGDEALEGLPLERFAARTAYFTALATAELDGRIGQRRVIVARDDARGGRTTVLFSLPVPRTLPPAAGN